MSSTAGLVPYSWSSSCQFKYPTRRKCLVGTTNQENQKQIRPCGPKVQINDASLYSVMIVIINYLYSIYGSNSSSSSASALEVSEALNITLHDAEFWLNWGSRRGLINKNSCYTSVFTYSFNKNAVYRNPANRYFFTWNVAGPQITFSDPSTKPPVCKPCSVAQEIALHGKCACDSTSSLTSGNNPNCIAINNPTGFSEPQPSASCIDP